jgi:hypothetical protein
MQTIRGREELTTLLLYHKRFCGKGTQAKEFKISADDCWCGLLAGEGDRTGLNLLALSKLARYNDVEVSQRNGCVMADNTVKLKVLKAVEEMPADVTFEDVMERLYFLYKVERGLQQVEAGDTLSNEEAKRQIKTWHK